MTFVVGRKSSSIFVTPLFTLLFVIVCVYCTLEIHVKRREGNKVEIPPPDDVVCMARYIVHMSNWCSLSYISKSDNFTYGTPLSRVYSMSDGLPENGTGIVYFMVSPLDLTVQDLLIQNNCSIIMTLAQSSYCRQKKYDAQDPRCGQVILSGNFLTIHNKTDPEYEFAKKVLFIRHPEMKYWFDNVPSHKWIFSKLKIDHIIVVDYFGGRKFPSVMDYFSKPCSRYLKDTDSDSSRYRPVDTLPLPNKQLDNKT